MKFLLTAISPISSYNVLLGRRMAAINIRKNSSIDVYLNISLFVSAIVWWCFYGMEPQKWHQSFFASNLFFGSYIMMREMLGKSYLFQRPSVYSSVFFFQIFSFLGIAFQEQAIGLLYLAIIPAMMGHYHAIVVDHRDYTTRQRTGIGFFLVPLFAIIALHNILPSAINISREAPILGLFVCWSLISLYSGSAQFQSSIGHITKFLQNTHQLPSSIDRGEADRLFFHDVINQTHGINLFLSSRISKNESVSPPQCRELLSEIRVIQAQIKDHYKLSHKNLVNNYEHVAFASIRKWIDRTVESFLPSDLVSTIITYNGLDRYSGTIHYPSFSRIFTNIIKNVSEVKTHEVWIHFEHHDRGVVFTVKNRLFEDDQNIVNLEQKLRENILNADRNPVVQGESGLGLESIYRQCRDQGGEFDFYLEDGHWVNKVFLPFSEQKESEVHRAA